jgi:apolipoprotein N-acyltransferase
MVKDGWVRVLLVVLSAGLMILAFPPFEWWGMALVSPVLLLASLRGASGRVGFYLGLLWGVLVYAGTLVWLWQVFQLSAVSLWMMIALFVGGFGGAYASLVAKRKEGWVTGVFAAVLWVGFEFFRSEWFHLRFPWITPGTGLPPSFLTSVVGVYGVSFLVVLAAAWILEPVKKVRISGGVLALGLLVLGFWSLRPIREARDGAVEAGVRVALVQSEEGFLMQYLEMTKEKVMAVDAVVWPEYAVSYDVREHPQDMAHLMGLARVRTRLVVLGSRTDLEDGEFHNTALTVGAEGVLGSHDKNRPVHFFNDGKPGTDPKPIETELGKIGTPICFDCDYTTVIRQLTQRGASFFLVPSMDAASWTDRQHEQHARLFRHRAAESGRWFAVAATSGVSQIIDPQGRVRGRLPTMADGVLLGSVVPRTEKTLYMRGGWLLGPCCVVLTLAFLVACSPWVQRWSVGRPR